MKGFIEVEEKSNKNKFLININYIEQVCGQYIYLAFNSPNFIQQDYVQCKETYEEIKQKIKEAVE